MCDFSGKLIAWMDGELPPEEAANVERHLAVCTDCRSGVATFRRISIAFDAHCETVMPSTQDHQAAGWPSLLPAAVAVTAAVILFLAWPRTRVPRLAPHFSQVVETAPVAANGWTTSVRPVEKFRRRRAAPSKQGSVRDRGANFEPAQGESSYIQPNERVIQIAIPADDMFPPGAVPQGMQFAADLTIAADGSAERLRLRPRLAEFERRTTLP